MRIVNQEFLSQSPTTIKTHCDVLWCLAIIGENSIHHRMRGWKKHFISQQSFLHWPLFTITPRETFFLPYLPLLPPFPRCPPQHIIILLIFYDSHRFFPLVNRNPIHFLHKTFRSLPAEDKIFHSAASGGGE